MLFMLWRRRKDKRIIARRAVSVSWDVMQNAQITFSSYISPLTCTQVEKGRLRTRTIGPRGRVKLQMLQRPNRSAKRGYIIHSPAIVPCILFRLRMHRRLLVARPIPSQLAIFMDLFLSSRRRRFYYFTFTPPERRAFVDRVFYDFSL